MSSTTQVRQRLDQAIGRRDAVQKRLEQKRQKLTTLQARMPAIEEAQALIQLTAQETQEQLKYHIEDIVQVAIDSCFPGEYVFCAKFDMKAGRTVCRLVLEDEVGNEVNPMDANGGGLVDLISFALRLSAWTLSQTDNVIVLDEPFKFLSENLRPVAGEILRKLRKKLGLQFIMVTHDPLMVEIADKVFEVKKNKKGISQVTVV